MFDNIKEVQSSDENVSKFVFTKEGKASAVAEAVLYKYPTYEERTVICCSTQSGCPMGCRFCGAGDYFVRNLTSDEIVFQVEHLFRTKNINANEVDKLQVMFMSMGEPLLNLKQLGKAIHELHSKYPKAALLISTSAPDIKSDKFNELIDLSIEVPTVGLQFSVHESTDEARDALIPFEKKMNLQLIANSGEWWHARVGRKPYFNYCVHDKNNDWLDVERIYSLFNPNVWECTLSVICESEEHVAAANQRQRTLVEDFMEKMLTAGYSVRMFDPAGQDDIGGGCGQLWFVQDWMKGHPERARPSIGNGKHKVHTPLDNQS